MEGRLADALKKLAELESRLTQERQLREEEQRRREEEQRRREEEQRRREIAEADAQHSQPTNLTDYLEACHKFSLALEIVTDATSTTQGDTTKPAGRPYPQRILPWEDFPRLQEKVWEKLSPPYNNKQAYPSAHQLEYVRKYLDPISSELGLRHFARETVENPVRTLIEEVYKDEQLREALKLRGTMMFESHTNLPLPSDASVQEDMERMSISDTHASHASGNRSKGKGNQGHKAGSAGRKRAGSADQFCIYEMLDGRRLPVVSIEYKPPHKLPLAQIAAGLCGEIHPAEEVINKEGDNFEFLSKSLVAAVITQLFSYMVRKGILWGYVFVGEAIIFLHIPNDPTTVLYHLSIPRLDVQDGDENRLHRTSVAQVFAFVLNSLSTDAPSQSWHDLAATLDTWAVEYIDILKKIPETERKQPHEISYKPGRWKGFVRSPIRTRSRRVADPCPRPADGRVHESHSESDSSDTPPTPTPNRTATGRRKEPGVSAANRRGARRNQRTEDASGQDKKRTALAHRIEERPFCTHQCLLGLAYGGDLDCQCPNIREHGEGHIPLSELLVLMRDQLSSDRGPDADCKPLYLEGLRGVLFKVRLSSHGYTLVAKGMRRADRRHLAYESEVYNHLRSLQGKYIPVSLGMVDLRLPCYYNGGIYTSMLFLSWAGRPLYQYLTPKYGTRILDQVNHALKSVHRRQVLHTDVKSHNWLWEEQLGKLMLIDFERAEIRARSPLGILSPNRKRNLRGNLKYEVKDEFYDELELARSSISRIIIFNSSKP
jgi:hypothetical protein